MADKLKGFNERLAEEERLAAETSNAEAKSAHLQLAMLYRTQIAILGRRSQPNLFATEISCA